MNLPNPDRIGTVLLAVSTSLLMIGPVVAAEEPPVKVDGSSTVAPITAALAKKFQAENKTPVAVAISGTTGGFKKFCAGQTDINDASRPISAAELQACKQAGVAFQELPIALDAVTVVVHPSNTWAESMTIAELKKLWEPTAQKTITRWKQVRSSWPDRPIKLYAPDKDSGTFDYFTEAVVGKTDASRTDYEASEDDDVLVKGVSNDPNALGYFGYAYYEANRTRLKAVAVDSGKGPVMPSRASVEDAKYQPLARPLFIYVNAKASQERPAVRAFVDYYLKNAAAVVAPTGYVPLPDRGYQIVQGNFYKGKVGSVYGGQQQLNLTIDEILRKQAEF